MQSQEHVHKILVYYPDEKEPEEIIGIIDYSRKMIKLIEINKDNSTGYKLKGYLNLGYIKRVEIKEKIGCLSDGDDICE